MTLKLISTKPKRSRAHRGGPAKLNTAISG